MYFNALNMNIVQKIPINIIFNVKTWIIHGFLFITVRNRHFFGQSPLPKKSPPPSSHNRPHFQESFATPIPSHNLPYFQVMPLKFCNVSLEREDTPVKRHRNNIVHTSYPLQYLVGVKKVPLWLVTEIIFVTTVILSKVFMICLL